MTSGSENLGDPGGSVLDKSVRHAPLVKASWSEAPLPLASAMLETFIDNLHFLRAMSANPRRVASLFPSSQSLARRIAKQVCPNGSGVVLELGPGTGAVTSALLERGVAPERLLLVERDRDFVRLLRKRFPGVCVQLGDALSLEEHLTGGAPAAGAIVSGLPLLNLSVRVRTAFVADCLRKLAPGAPFVQLSFGWRPPVAECSKWAVRSAGVAFRNMPPAHVWVYTRR